MTTLDFATRGLALSGLAVEGLCVLSFVTAGKIRTLPLVFSFLAYLFFSDAGLILVAQTSASWPALLITTYISYFFEIAAIWELACRTVLDLRWETVRTKLRFAALWFALFVLAAFLLTNLRSYGDFNVAERNFLTVDLSASIFRALVFGAILGFTRRDVWFRNVLVARVTLLFAAYAICDLIMHVFNELDPWLRFPAAAFETSQCVCGYVWVFLLLVLVWQLLLPRERRSQSLSAPPVPVSD